VYQNSPQDSRHSSVNSARRDFLKQSAAGVLASAAVPALLHAEEEKPTTTPESLVKNLYDSFTPKQKETVCFEWDHQDPKRGLLRTFVANNWHITQPKLASSFYTKDQLDNVRAIFEGIIAPEWHERVYKQLSDDAGGFGKGQDIAIFGNPNDGKFEFVLTGRHMTLRCDGNSAEHVAFGGPLFYGHAAEGFVEEANHPGNVYWEQAIQANKVYEMLDGKQRKQAEVAKSIREQNSGFRGKEGDFAGIPVTELSEDQKAEVQKTLGKLVEMYRQSDQDEVIAALKKQGGIDACHLAFFTDEDVGNDKVWDNWRLEGPSFVWHFRGSPHVHVWVNVADDPSPKLNA
jgi:hypothetical protein